MSLIAMRALLTVKCVYVCVCFSVVSALLFHVGVRALLYVIACMHIRSYTCIANLSSHDASIWTGLVLLVFELILHSFQH